VLAVAVDALSVVANGVSTAPAPLRLGDPVLDALSFREPDLSIYDQVVPTPMTRDPGESPEPEGGAMKRQDDQSLELLLQKLRWLKLPAMAQCVSELLERAAKENLSVLEIVHRLCDEERASRIKRAVDRRIRDARFPEVNTVDGFDFDFDGYRKKARARYLALHDLTFLDKGINPIFMGTPGTGKTFLARALAYRACQGARRVVVTSD